MMIRMLWHHWFRRLFPFSSVSTLSDVKRTSKRYRLRVEALEDRRLLANISSDPLISQLLPMEGTVEHYHPRLTIIINGQQQVIPADIGIPLDSNGNPAGYYPIHTHDASGTIHVESPVAGHTFFLHDFFDVWGMPFDQTHILDFHTPASNPITMTVAPVIGVDAKGNPQYGPAQPNNQYGNLVLRDPGLTNPALHGLGDNIVITATNAQGPGSFFAVGGNGHVEIRRNVDGVIVSDFYPFGISYTGGLSVAVGDVNKDGFKDLVVAATSVDPHVKVYDGKAIASGTFSPINPDASLLASFDAFPPSGNVGVNVALGDVLGDGYMDIVTGASSGNPDVRLFSGKDIATGHSNPTAVTQFFAYGLQFNVGANVAVGDLNKDGFADIITGATAGNPHVKVYSGKAIAKGTFNHLNPDASLITQFFAYGLQFNVGAFVAVGDVNGDGDLDLITGASAGNPHVKVYNGAAFVNGSFNNNNPDASLMNSFFAYDLQFNVGAAVAAADFEGTGKFDILTGASVGSPHYRIVKGNATGTKPPSVNGLEGIPPDIKGGIMVGA
jgi:hypothetical protein